MSLFWFIVVITPIIFVHELGHFLFARLFGIKVEVFSIGFGKPLIRYKDSRGTLWQIAIIPLGGFIKVHGDQHNKLSNKKNHHYHKQQIFLCTKKLWQKALIVIGGPLANYILALSLFITCSIFAGIKESELKIASVRQSSPAQIYGLKLGDIIVNINGKKVNSAHDFKNVTTHNLKNYISVGIVRDDDYRVLDIRVKDKRVDNTSYQMDIYDAIGITCESHYLKNISFYKSLIFSINKIYDISITMLRSILGLICFNNQNSLGGPIKIAIYSKNTAEQGVISILYFIAVLSLNLGFINLLPIPMLDGGYLIFYAIEAIIRRPISDRMQSIFFKIGFSIMITVMLIAFFNDLKDMNLFLI